jgi:CRISPR-associated protein Csm3
MAAESFRLRGRVFLSFNLRTLTGLHIGGSDVGVEIGGIDKTVIRDVLSNQPYIPGSSLRGKMRSLTEKYQGKPQNKPIGRASIHTCMHKEEYLRCSVCQVYGVPAEKGFNSPTRLVVRDVHLEPASAERLHNEAHTDLPFTEIKTEVAIDRITSVANPRRMERVPRDVVFGPAEMVYSVYAGGDCDPARDIENLRVVVLGLKLLEDDYLGGLGSRGSGRVKVEGLRLGLKDGRSYGPEPEWLTPAPLAGLGALDGQMEELLAEIKRRLLA